jgi:hypothetical protein
MGTNGADPNGKHDLLCVTVQSSWILHRFLPDVNARSPSSLRYPRSEAFHLLRVQFNVHRPPLSTSIHYAHKPERLPRSVFVHGLYTRIRLV